MVAIKICGGKKNETKIILHGPNDSVKDVIEKNFDMNLEDCDQVFAGSKSSNYDTSKMTQVQLDMEIDNLKTLIDVEQIVVKLKEVQCLSPRRNAFTMLMTVDNSVIKIDKIVEKTGKDKIFNVLIDYLTETRIVFTRKYESFKNSWFSTLTSVIWLIDCHTYKFSKLPNCPPLPKDFFQVKYRSLSHDGMIKKKSPDNLKREDLYSAAMKLDNLLHMKVDNTGNWEKMLSDIAMLKSAIDFYIDYLSQANNLSEEQQSDRDDEDKVKLIPGDKLLAPFHISVYKKLEAKLSAAIEYTPVLVFEYAPLNKRQRYDYIRKLKFGFPIQIFRLNSPICYFVWKIPEILDESHDTKLVNLTKQLRSAENVNNIKHRISTKINKDFENNYNYDQDDVECLVSFVSEGKCFTVI